MKQYEYTAVREDIRDGDLLIWSKRSFSSLGDIFPWVVRIATASDYNHVGIAVRLNGRLCCVEAEIPHVRPIPVSKRRPFYTIPMNLDLTKEDIDFLIDKWGDRYSIPQAIISYFARPFKDNRWQCVELVKEFYQERLKIVLGDSYTPAGLVQEVLKLPNTAMRYVE